MRKNTLLTTAISSALLLPLSSMAQTPFEQFVNVGEAISNSDYNKQGAAQLLFESGNNPAYRFDQDTTVKVANVPGLSTPNEIPNVTQGTPFANILFGGTVTIPTEITAGMPGSGGYLAAMYTIDGDIVQDFQMKFILDNGAVFADKPLIGVRDELIPEVTIQGFDTTSNSMSVTPSGITAGSLFKFATDTNIYVASPVTAGTNFATVQFWRLGGKPEAVAVPPSGVAEGSKLSYQNKAPVAHVYNPIVGVLQNVVTFTSGTAIMTLSISPASTDMSAFLVAGWTYTCSAPAPQVASGFTTGITRSSQTIFKATTVADKGTNGVVMTAQLAGEPSVRTSGICNTGGTTAIPTIVRVHVAGDTIIHVTADASAASPVLSTIFTGDAKPYKFSGFSMAGTAAAAPGATVMNYDGTSSYGSTVIYPNNNLTFTAKVGTVNTPFANTITISQPLKCALAGNACNLASGAGQRESIYDVDISSGVEWSKSNLTTKWPEATFSGGTATFNMPATNFPLETYDQIMLFYRLGNLGALAEPGGKVNMTTTLIATGGIDKLVNPERTITVARSVEALEVDVTPTTGDVKISITASQKEFTGETTGDAFVNQNRAYIGYVTVYSDPDEIGYLQDAASPFSFDKAAASQSKFTITGGQFQASAVSPGQVAIEGVNGAISADQLTIDGDGFWAATWNLDSTDLQAIMDMGKTGAKILMQVDGTNTINSVENSPTGLLEVDFDDTFMVDLITEEKDLKRITKDGSVCTIYNVPPPTGGVIGADVLNLRITNDSAAAGSVTGHLYGEDGAELKLGIPLVQTLEKGQTAHLTSDDIAKLAGDITWTGRGIMRVETTISQVEMLAMLRQLGVPAAPLSNVSVGADGEACSSN